MLFRKLFVLLHLISCVQGLIEIDVDEDPQHNIQILVGNKSYQCTPKNPPLGHGWAFECETIGNRRLRGLRAQQNKW